MISVQVPVLGIAGIKIPQHMRVVRNSSESDSLHLPSVTTFQLETAEYNAGFAARKGLLSSSNPMGHFSFNIPLSHIFGFAEYTESHIRSETYSHID